jgi:acyl dehydratase
MELIFFDDIEVPGRLTGPEYTVDRDEMTAFAETWDPLPIHLDEAFARQYGGITASGPYLLALRIRLIHGMDRQPAVIASFGYDEVRFKAPVHAGDRLHVVLEFTAKRPSSSKPDRGIVTARQNLINQDDLVVLTVLDSVLVRRRPA